MALHCSSSAKQTKQKYSQIYKKSWFSNMGCKLVEVLIMNNYASHNLTNLHCFFP